LATGILNNVEIKGIACAVPDNIRASEEYNEVFGEEKVQKSINMTGVKKDMLPWMNNVPRICAMQQQKNY
jgi:hypothetical protein